MNIRVVPQEIIALLVEKGPPATALREPLN
jgi:hypothetical protein